MVDVVKEGVDKGRVPGQALAEPARSARTRPGPTVPFKRLAEDRDQTDFETTKILQMKRLIDLIASIAGLIVFLPVLAILILMIKRESSGSAIFAQDRVGQDARVFRCFKLRTMHSDTPHVPTHEAAGSQITPLGRRLRRIKVDELPQLWNVIRGEMSLVGPRPCLPTQKELIEERRKRGVLALKPGITGLAQINSIDMSDPVKLATVDAEYLRSKSLLMDLQILFRTVFNSAGRGDRIRS
jgi:O-antigen biosynthesis protein WbqP